MHGQHLKKNIWPSQWQKQENTNIYTENNKEEGNAWEKQKNKQKKNDTDSKVEAFIDQPRDTTLYRNNAAPFITGKQKNIWYNASKNQKIREIKSFGQFSRNLERKIRRLQASCYIEIVMRENFKQKRCQ